jgi:Methyltransferase domain
MNRTQKQTPPITCRLCGQRAMFAFSKQVLARHTVNYFRCDGCHSMLTEQPYWLDEAYAIPGVHIDVGGASRTLKNWVALATLLQRLDHPKEAVAVDFGAASGLLGRLMRDIGYNFYSYDKFAVPAFSNYNMLTDLSTVAPRLVTAFEVFEHFPEPREELERLFAMDAPLIVFTTWFCDGQDEAWVYFVPECGQHVFFYSEQAMRNFAGAHGYELRSSSFFHILSRPDAFTADQRAAIDGFTIHSAAWARDGSADLLASVCMGNAFIDADFEAARIRFARERSEAAGNSIKQATSKS